MAFTKNTAETNKTNYTAKVTGAKVVGTTSKGGEVVSFDMEVNGISITHCSCIEYTNKNNETKYMVKFPQHKSKNDKYSNIVWFPISKELNADIVAQIIRIITEI